MIDTRKLMVKLSESAVVVESDDKSVCSKCGSHNIDEEGICKDCGFKTECKDSSECKDTNEGKEEEPTESDDFGYEGAFALECPECKEVFTSDVKITSCECPECGAEISPEFLGQVESIEEDAEVAESFIKVTGGKKVKFSKKAKSGFKRVDGKYVKMSTKEINARKKSVKKASKKSNTSTAKRKRAKSMDKRQSLVANFQLENALIIDVLNTAIGTVYESIKDTYYVPTVESIENHEISESNLVLSTSVKYDDGVTESVDVVVKNFSETAGDYQLESADLFGDNHKVTVGLAVTEGILEPTKLDYSVTLGESVIEGGVIVE